MRSDVLHCPIVGLDSAKPEPRASIDLFRQPHCVSPWLHTTTPGTDVDFDEYFDFKKDDMTLPFGLMGRPGFSKRKEFEHEKEVRGMVRQVKFPENLKDLYSDEYADELAKVLPKGIEIEVDLVELISQIVLSPFSEEWYFQLVRSIAMSHGLGDLVQRSTLDDNTPVY